FSIHVAIRTRLDFEIHSTPSPRSSAAQRRRSPLPLLRAKAARAIRLGAPLFPVARSTSWCSTNFWFESHPHKQPRSALDRNTRLRANNSRCAGNADYPARSSRFHIGRNQPLRRFRSTHHTSSRPNLRSHQIRRPEVVRKAECPLRKSLHRTKDVHCP